MYQVGRTEDFQKCKAICDLIKLWFHKDETNLEDNIITLGIASDGKILWNFSNNIDININF